MERAKRPSSLHAPRLSLWASSSWISFALQLTDCCHRCRGASRFSRREWAFTRRDVSSGVTLAFCFVVFLCLAFPFFGSEEIGVAGRLRVRSERPDHRRGRSTPATSDGYDDEDPTTGRASIGRAALMTARLTGNWLRPPLPHANYTLSASSATEKRNDS